MVFGQYFRVFGTGLCCLSLHKLKIPISSSEHSRLVNCNPVNSTSDRPIKYLSAIYMSQLDASVNMVSSIKLNVRSKYRLAHCIVLDYRPMKNITYSLGSYATDVYILFVYILSVSS